MYSKRSEPAAEQDNNSHSSGTLPAEEQRPKPARYNPRLVFVNPDDFFIDLLMEQNEQQ